MKVLREVSKSVLKMDSMDRQLADIRRQFRQLGPGEVTLERDLDRGVAVIQFKNEERKNSLSGRMMTQFWESIKELENWKNTKAVVIRGHNRFFCSGGDLNTVRTIADPLNGRKMSLLMHNALTRLQSLPFLSLAQIEGMAIGGGAEIATACDLRVMREGARIGFVHVKVGIVSAWGGGARLSALIGPQMALDLMFSGRLVEREEALKMGLIDGLVDGDTCAEDWLEEKYNLSDKSFDLIRGLKRILTGSRFLPLELALNEELESSVSVWGKEEHLKRLLQNVKHN